MKRAAVISAKTLIKAYKKKDAAIKEKSKKKNGLQKQMWLLKT